MKWLSFDTDFDKKYWRIKNNINNLNISVDKYFDT